MTVTVQKCRKAALLMPDIHFKSTKHFTVRGILVVRDCFKMFQLLRIWSISQYLSATRLSHCKATIDSMIHNSGSYFIWYIASVLGFFCTLPPSILSPLLPLGCWPWCFLEVHPLSECLALVLSSVYICFPIEGWCYFHARFSYFWEVVYTGWSILSSLVKVKINFMANLQKV